MYVYVFARMFSNSFQRAVMGGVLSEHCEREQTIYVDLISILMYLTSTNSSKYFITFSLSNYLLFIFLAYVTEKYSFPIFKETAWSICILKTDFMLSKIILRPHQTSGRLRSGRMVPEAPWKTAALLTPLTLGRDASVFSLINPVRLM